MISNLPVFLAFALVVAATWHYAYRHAKVLFHEMGYVSATHILLRDGKPSTHYDACPRLQSRCLQEDCALREAFAQRKLTF